MGRRKKTIKSVSIVDIGHKGSAIGRSPEGEVIQVLREAVPGDICDVLVLRNKKGIKQGVPVNFVRYSADRIAPFCEHFGHCGGCSWQNLSYSCQISLKEKWVRELISRVARENPDKVQPIIGCEKTEEFRNKLEYTFSSRKWLTREQIDTGDKLDTEHALGFHISGHFDKIIDINNCHLQHHYGNEIRNEIRAFTIKQGYSFYDLRTNTGFLRNVTIRNSRNGQWMVTLVFGERRPDQIQFLFDHMVQMFPVVTSWNYLINEKKNSSTFDLEVNHGAGKEFIRETIGGISFRISAKSFFQTNPVQAELLFKTALDMSSLSREDVVYDLYSGTGSISLLAAQKVKKVVAIEEVFEAVNDAKANAADNKIDNVFFETGDVRDLLNASLQGKYGSPDVLFTDPPRAGMHKDVLMAIIRFKPKRIIYISCNPATQARDILTLLDCYELDTVVPVDMFPHTSHVESVARLTLKKM